MFYTESSGGVYFSELFEENIYVICFCGIYLFYTRRGTWHL